MSMVRSGGVCSCSEINDVGRSRNSCRSGCLDGGVWLFETVFHEEVQVVTLIKDLALDIGMSGTKLANLPIFLGDEFLTHGRDLDVDVVLREIEVWTEERRGFACVVPIDRKRGWFVLPVDDVEVQQSRELPFAVVSELGGLGR